MIEFKPADLKQEAYTYTLLGNAGEEQFVVTASGMQDGRYSLCILTVSCDSFVNLRLHVNSIPPEHVWLHLDRELRTWSEHGARTPRTLGEHEIANANINAVVTAICAKLAIFWEDLKVTRREL